MQTSARLMTLAARVTVVADREGDIFEMFACRPEGVEFLIRAAQDRMLSEGAGKLFSSLANRPEEDHTIELPARPGQKKRKARIGVRFANVTLRKPKNRTLEPGVAMRQPVCIVEAREIDPPGGVTPAHWRLLTSHRVENFEQARWITQLYRRRWVIEQLFRTIKSKGFDIENVSMETAPFRTLCAMTLVAGISCMQLVQDRDGEGKRPLQDVFEVEDQPALEAVSASLEGKTEKQKNPTPERIPRFRSMGVRPSRGLDRILRQTRTRCDAARAVSIQSHPTRVRDPWKCVNPVALRVGARICRIMRARPSVSGRSDVAALAPGLADRNLDEPNSRYRRCTVGVLRYRSSRR